MMSLRLHGWDVGIGVAVGAFGVWEATSGAPTTILDVSGSVLLVALLMAVAAALYRAEPALALILVWATCAFQLVKGLDVALVQLAAAIVAFGTARYGQAVTVWLSGLSIPIGSALALVYVRTHGTATLSVLTDAVAANGRISTTTAFLLPLSVLSLPWALGLVLRLTAGLRRTREEAEQAEIEAARAQEIAAVRAEQARLARDVHDVVGHSLTVILAQADSADYMDDQDIDRIRAALRNISTSARQSLGDVRQVLSTTSEAPNAAGGGAQPLATGGLDSLVDGVRSAGNDVRSTVQGTPRPMPPELDVVAFRVLQEMLTNALKHGRRGEPITVERCFDADVLRIEVRNIAAAAVPGDAGGTAIAEGLGLPGMHRRLDAVGGRLAVRPDEAPEGPLFTATAWVPLRPNGALP